MNYQAQVESWVADKLNPKRLVTFRHNPALASGRGHFITADGKAPHKFNFIEDLQELYPIICDWLLAAHFDTIGGSLEGVIVELPFAAYAGVMSRPANILEYNIQRSSSLYMYLINTGKLNENQRIPY